MRLFYSPHVIMRMWGINLGKGAGAYMDIKSIVKELCAYDDEQEWFEFKENWFQPETLMRFFAMGMSLI